MNTHVSALIVSFFAALSFMPGDRRFSALAQNKGDGAEGPDSAAENGEDAKAEKPPTAPEPARTPAAPARELKTSRFTAPLPEGWKSEINDFGAETALRRDDKSDAKHRDGEGAAARHIDVFREAVNVVGNGVGGFLAAYVSRLAPPKERGGVVDKPEVREVNGRKLGSVRLSVNNASLQEYWLLFTEDGVYTFVLTTNELNVEKDRAALLALTRGFSLRADRSAADRKALDKLPFIVTPPEGWLASTSVADDTALRLAPPLEEKPGSFIPGLDIAALDQTFGGEESQKTFTRTFRETFMERFAADPAPIIAVREETRAGMTSFRIDASGATAQPDPARQGSEGEAAEIVKYRLVVLFGTRKTYTLTLACPPARFDALALALDNVLETFAER